MQPTWEQGGVKLWQGDCLCCLPSIPTDSIDAIVTDPPAGIEFMQKQWDSFRGDKRQPGDSTFHKSGAGPFDRSKVRHGTTGGYGNSSVRDNFITFIAERMREALRVLKPGGHALVWALPRTSHWTAMALEDAGFEIRDRVSHLFGSGFPKSLDVSKQIDRMAGVERDVVGLNGHAHKRTGAGKSGTFDNRGPGLGGIESATITAPATEAAHQWNGWGTALKPACEDWWLCRKPLEGTIAENVLKWGTGAINIDQCRIPTNGERPLREVHPLREDVEYQGNSLCGRVDNTLQSSKAVGTTALGRWPANLIHDGSEEVLEAFARFGERPGAVSNSRPNDSGGRTTGRFSAMREMGIAPGPADNGTAARFFYCPKASREDRGEFNNHPTVKATELMRYLCRLITPPGGTILDCFAGSGSTGKAAILEGFGFVGMESEAGSFEIAKRRMIEALDSEPLLAGLSA